MRTFLFTYNPDKWHWPEDDLRDEIRLIENGHRFKDRWSTGKRKKDLPKGSRFFLIRLGKTPKGIIGSGWTMSNEPYENDHYTEQGRSAWYVDVEFDALSEDPIIPIEYLQETQPFNKLASKWTPQTSALEITEVADALENEWSRRLKKSIFIYPEELEERSSFPEGAKKQITVNAYERNAQARQICIDHYGPQCFVCGFSFTKEYPGIPQANGYIHVHHLTPLSDTGGNYEIDPIKDLRPVCPNCHAALHFHDPPFSIEDMKRMLGR